MIQRQWIAYLLASVVVPTTAFFPATTFTRTQSSVLYQRQNTLMIDGQQVSAFPPPTDDDDNSNVLDVLVCGAGPAGLLLASELSQLNNLKVGIVDPAIQSRWPNNYGVWMDEAEYFGYSECVDRVWKTAGVIFDEDTPELVLQRPYGRVDRKALKNRLIRTCQEHNVVFAPCKATKVQHFDDQPSVVTLQSGSSPSTTVSAMLVVDATGFCRQFVEHNTAFDPGYQVTYGARMRVRNLGPYTLDRMVLMDYCEQHLADDAKLVASNKRFPSFVYAMPLSETELFLEETVLVSRPGASSRDLQQRLEKRMQALGIEVVEILEDERAAIPMGGADPVVPQRTLGFGATSSLVHPASGYMVARAMEIAPRVAQSVAPRLRELRKQWQKTQVLDKASLDTLSKEGWNAVWPVDERRQRDFMHFGFELLCLLDPQELRDFFTGFFKLPDGLWEHFLSWRLSGVGHIVMGLRVWAQCIPRRFMPAMLIKSLPFIANRLVLPAASRGNYESVYTDSVYWDARSNGESKQWEPAEYYPYLVKLSKEEGKDSKSRKDVKDKEETLRSTNEESRQQVETL